MKPTKGQLDRWNKLQAKSRKKYQAKLKNKPRKKIRRQKKGSLTYWKNKAISEAKRVVRSKGECERCGQTDNLQGSHIIPLSASSLIGADTDNILCLCVSCHLYWWHRHPLAASEWFNEKWPGRKKELEDQAKSLVNNKPTADDWKAKYESLLKAPY